MKVKLKDLLLEKQMPMRQLAIKAGVHENVIYRICNGKTNGVEFKTLNSICGALDCNVSDILEFTKEIA